MRSANNILPLSNLTDRYFVIGITGTVVAFGNSHNSCTCNLQKTVFVLKNLKSK